MHERILGYERRLCFLEILRLLGLDHIQLDRTINSSRFRVVPSNLLESFLNDWTILVGGLCLSFQTVKELLLLIACIKDAKLGVFATLSKVFLKEI